MWTPDLDEGLPKPAAIVRALQLAIETGQLAANERLPPQRELAYALGVNLSTVSRAMAEAAKRGLVAGEVGRGTYILPESPAAQLFQDAIARRDTIDLSTISPPDIDAGLLLNALRPSHTIDARNSLGYPSPDLLDQARTAVRKWLDWRGLRIADGSTVLTAGAHAALQSLLPMLIQPGETVLTEEFTFPGIKTLTALTGIRLQGVPCDAQGLLPEALDHAVRATKARVLVAVPNMQNPTAAVMGPQRRAEISEVISRLGLTLVEDDIYGSYVGMPPLMAQLAAALDGPGARYATGRPVVARARSAVTRAYARFWQRLPFARGATPGFGLYAVNAEGRARWGAFPAIIADDTFVRLNFAPAERIGCPATYSWPMVEGLRALVRVRRRQDAGVAEVARLFPGLGANDDTPRPGPAALARAALADPAGLAVYALVALAVRARRADGAWARGR